MTDKLLHNERELLQLAAEGDRIAYGQLYAHFYPDIHSSIAFIAGSATEAEEIVQEVFIKIWLTRETLVLVRSFGDFVFTVARNRWFDKLRQIKSRNKAEQEYIDRHTTGISLPDNELLYKQYYNAANQALQQLSPQKQQIFLLRTQRGLTLDEIAAEVDLSRSSVKKHLYTAIEHLKRSLASQGDWLGFFFF